MTTYREALSGLLVPEETYGEALADLVNERNGDNGTTYAEAFRRAYHQPRIEPFPRPPAGGGVVVEPYSVFVARLQTYSRLYFNPDEAYRQQRTLQVAMERDPVVMEPLMTRMMSVALLDWEIQPENEDDAEQKALAAMIAKQVKRVPFFTKMKLALMWALWYGKQSVQLQWKWDDLENSKYLGVRGWSPIRGDKITFDQASGQLGIYVNAAASRGIDRKEQERDRQELRYGPEARVRMIDQWERDAFIVHKHELVDGDFFEPESAGAIHGLGLRHRVWWPWYFKQNALQWVMEWMQRLGTGFTIWYYDQDNPSSESKVREAAEKQKSGTQILFPRSSDQKTRGAGIERIEASPGGTQSIIDFLDKYWGNQIKMMIAGQTLTSEVGATGLGGNVAEKHENTKQQITRFDALNLDETLTNELIGPMVRYRNKQQMRLPILPVRYQSILEKKDPDKVMQAVGRYLEFGGEVPDEYAREIAGIPKPKKGEKTLSKAQQQPGFGGFGNPSPMVDKGMGQGELPFGGQEHDDFDPDAPDILTYSRKRQRYAHWQGPHTGPRGGHFWINAETGEKRYDEPGSDETVEEPGGEAPSESIAESGRKAEQAVSDRSGKFSDAMDGMADGSVIKSGRRTFKKHTVAGETFWEYSIDGKYKGHLSSAQTLTEAGSGPVISSLGFDPLSTKPEPAAPKEIDENENPKEPEAEQKTETDSQLDLFQDYDGDISKPSPFEEKTQDMTPRKAAEAKPIAKDPDYIFARASKIANAGEDLLGSARHKRNAWRGLAEAESNGSAEEMVTRNMLLKAEPTNFIDIAESGNAISALAMHLAFTRFPENPPKTKDGKAARQEFFDVYMTLKGKAESLAKEHNNPIDALREFKTAIYDEVKRLREAVPGATGSYPIPRPENDQQKAQLEMSNDLARYFSRVGDTRRRRPQANSALGQLAKFTQAVKEKYGESKDLDAIKQHAIDVMEGISLPKSFGTSEKGKERFNSADMYVTHAERKGGRVIDAKTVKAGTKFVMDDLGMRGLQWGNSVTDDERQHHLTKTAEAFADLADTLGLPDKFMSLGGKLGLAIGARGHGGARAHYEPSTKVINLTRKSGVGSLAHEWGHALDNYLGGGADKYLSNRWDDKSPLGDAMRNVLGAMESSGYSKRLATALRSGIYSALISPKERAYWESRVETFARSFERFVQEKIQKNDQENTYLIGLRKKKAEFWPNDEETAAMAPHFENLLSEIRKTSKEHFAKLNESFHFAKEEHWITIGSQKEAPEGEKGGSPVKVDSEGNITKGAPSLHGRNLGNLKESGKDERTQRQQSRHAGDYAHAKRRKEAKEAGLNPDAVEQAYDWLRSHQDAENKHYNDFLAFARDKLGLSKRNKAFAKGDDADTLQKQGYPFDEVADSLAVHSEEFAPFFEHGPSAPHYSDQLFEMIGAGPKQAKSDDELWENAMEMAFTNQTPGKASDYHFARDRTGREHRGKGPGGGQFVSGSIVESNDIQWPKNGSKENTVWRIQPRGSKLHGQSSQASDESEIDGVFVFDNLNELSAIDWMNEENIELVEIKISKGDLFTTRDQEGVGLKKGHGEIVARKAFTDTREASHWAESEQRKQQ